MDIPYQNLEIEQIYYQLLQDPFRTIAVCSANEGEGVTSLALALTKRNLMAGYSTLYVDLNLYRPAVKQLFSDITFEKNHAELPHSDKSLSLIAALGQPQLISLAGDESVVNGIVAPTAREHVLKLKQSGALEACITQWRKEYDTVIIDTSPLNRINANNIPAERVAAACDGAVLAILAGKTTTTMVNTAIEKLNASEVNLLGCIYNDRDNPHLKTELIRQIKRIPPWLGWIKNRLIGSIHKSKLLSMEV